MFLWGLKWFLIDLLETYLNVIGFLWLRGDWIKAEGQMLIIVSIVAFVAIFSVVSSSLSLSSLQINSQNFVGQGFRMSAMRELPPEEIVSQGREQQLNIRENANELGGLTFEMQQLNKPKNNVGIVKKFLPGCHFVIEGAGDLVLDKASKSDCESLYLADKYVSREDLLLLLESIYPANKDLKKVLLPSKELFFVNTDLNIISFEYMEDKINSKECEKIYFFDVQLFCFNGIIRKAPDRLRNMVDALTFLKITSSRRKVDNKLFKEHHLAYDFVVSKNIVYYDGNKGNKILKVKDTKCGGGAGNFQKAQSPPNYANEHRVYMCGSMYKNSKLIDADKPRYAAIIYHEANHLKQQGHFYNTTTGKKVNVGNGDKNWDSVYGAHIIYLFTVSEDKKLPCKYRKDAYSKGDYLLNKSLYIYPPSKKPHRFKPPVC